MPYIPDKKNRYSMPYQIPFILMASLSLKRWIWARI
jgi:hypothetical protein